MTPVAQLQAYHLSIGHPGKTLCANLEFTLPPGRLTALLGRNGSGKTTLLLTLAGLRIPLEGAVTFGGAEMGKDGPRRRARQVALMLPSRNLPESLRGRELVELGRWPHTPWHGKLSGGDHEKVHTAMTLTGTLAFADRPLGRLSDGEKQKLCIARALAQEAEVLLLDEPLSHLDAPSRVEILVLLRRLAETEGKAVLFSCHDLDLAYRHSHQVLALLSQAAWRGGTPGEISSDPGCAMELGLYTNPSILS